MRIPLADPIAERTYWRYSRWVDSKVEEMKIKPFSEIDFFFPIHGAQRPKKVIN